jgi:predicted transcriptional regulator
MTLTLTENKPKRRDKLVIMAEIVDIAKKGTSKTHIMFKANLSFSQLNQYLALLSQASLLEKFSFNGKEIYKATQKGTEFMQKQYQIISILNENNLNSVKCSSSEYYFFQEVKSHSQTENSQFLA